MRSLERMHADDAVMPLYELMQNELADPFVRRNAAEALVTLGLLRRERTGPSLIFMWVAGIGLLVAALGAGSTIGPWAVLVFAAGIGVLGTYAVLERRRSQNDVYIGPAGERIRLRRDRIDGDEGDAAPWPEFDGLDL